MEKLEERYCDWTLSNYLLEDGQWLDRRLICIDDQGQVTSQSYRELRTRVIKAANVLRSLGIKKGDRVCISLEDYSEFFIVLWGCILTGAIAVPTAKADTEQILRDVSAALLVEHGDGKYEVAHVSFAMLQNGTADHDWETDMHAEDVIAILFTSGSTGKSKGVQLTAGNLLANIRGNIQTLQLGEEDKFLNWLPLNHCTAFVQFHLMPVCLHAEQVHIAVDYILKQPYRWADLMSKWKTTISWAPNFAFKMAGAEDDRKTSVDLSALRHLISAGEMATFSAFDTFEQKYKPCGLKEKVLSVSWGMTETCGMILHSDGWRDNVRVKNTISSGKTIPGITIREEGELFVNGDAVVRNYLNVEKITEDFYDGWLRTGDCGTVCGDVVSITGRKKDIIIKNGRNVSCVELEEGISQRCRIPLGFLICTVEPDLERGTDRVYLFTDETKVWDKEKIQVEIGRIMAENYGFTFDSLMFIRESNIPKTAIGKIKRNQLKKMVWTAPKKNVEKRESSRKNQNDICEMISLWENVLKLQPVHADDNFFRIGGTSAMIPFLLDEIEKKFGCRLKISDIFLAPTVSELLAILEPNYACSHLSKTNNAYIFDI